MKRSVAMLAFTVQGVFMAQGEDNMQSNQVFVTSVIQTLGEKAINAFPDPSPILGLLETSLDFARLCEGAEKTWKESISSFATNSLNRASRLVLLHSYLYLSPKVYMRCLEQVLDLFQQGRIQRDELVYIFLIPPREENRWFLSYNADKSPMVKFLQWVRAAFEHDTQMKHLIGFIIEGKARIRDELLRSEKVSLSKRNVPYLSED